MPTKPRRKPRRNPLTFTTCLNSLRSPNPATRHSAALALEQFLRDAKDAL